MSVCEFLESEVIEKKRTALYSFLLRKFGNENVLENINHFFSSNSQLVSLLVSQSSLSSDGAHVISLVNADKVTDRLFAIKPRDSNESYASVFRRDREDVKAEMRACNESLWSPSHALITASHPLEQRAIRNSTGPASNFSSKPTGQISNPSSKPIGQAVNPSSKPIGQTSNASAKPIGQTVNPSSKPIGQTVNPSSKPASTKALFTVPLDRLGDPDDEIEEKEKVIEHSLEVEQDAAAPQVAVTVSDSSEAPTAKRQRVDGDEDKPQYREVTIKKKVIVTEYEMGPNGEMVVKDVEKMVEETKLELVKAPHVTNNNNKSNSASSSATRKEPKPAKAGQGTLSGFFKPK